MNVRVCVCIKLNHSAVHLKLYYTSSFKKAQNLLSHGTSFSFLPSERQWRRKEMSIFTKAGFTCVICKQEMSFAGINAK